MTTQASPENSLALKLKEQGNAAFNAGDFTRAVELFTDAIDISPKDHILYSNRSGAYASLKLFEKARTDAAKCTQISPNWAKGWVRLGVACLGLGNDLKLAREAYAKALTLDPQNLSAKEGLEKLASSVPGPVPAPAASGVKRKLERVRSEQTSRADLIAELYAPGPMKIKNELVKRLNEFPACKQIDTIDPVVLAKDLELVTKSAQTPFGFVCVRCDKAKISTLLATWKKDQFMCHACYDHVTRCVIPVRDLHPSQRPEKCIHEVPRGYQKQFRN